MQNGQALKEVGKTEAKDMKGQNPPPGGFQKKGQKSQSRLQALADQWEHKISLVSGC